MKNAPSIEKERENLEKERIYRDTYKPIVDNFE